MESGLKITFYLVQREITWGCRAVMDLPESFISVDNKTSHVMMLVRSTRKIFTNEVLNTESSALPTSVS